jgi:hypothetical protein
VITLPKVMLCVGIMCLGVAVWASIHAEFRNALFGLGLGAFLIFGRRWVSAQSR